MRIKECVENVKDDKDGLFTEREAHLQKDVVMWSEVG